MSQRIHGLSSFFPLDDLWVEGPEGDEELSGQKILA